MAVPRKMSKRSARPTSLLQAARFCPGWTNEVKEKAQCTSVHEHFSKPCSSKLGTIWRCQERCPKRSARPTSLLQAVRFCSGCTNVEKKRAERTSVREHLFELGSYSLSTIWRCQERCKDLRKGFGHAIPPLNHLKDVFHIQVPPATRIIVHDQHVLF